MKQKMEIFLRLLMNLRHKLFCPKNKNTLGDKMEKICPSNFPYATIYKIKRSEIEKIDFASCAQPNETLEAFYERQTVKPEILINGGFFELSSGQPVFTYIDEGEEITVDKNFLEGIGTDGTDLVLDTYNENYKDFIAAYPVLMKNGRRIYTSMANEINYSARRTVFGYDEIYVYIIIIEVPGYNFSSIKSLLVEYGIPNAINLDGGASTRILVNGKNESSSLYSRAVDNVVAIYLKKEKVIYRVQTGAYSIRANAEKFLKEIQSLSDNIGVGYKNAYIRLINGLYKVQVGAFSVKSNAERVVKDLKEKGYNSFITT